jgi:hypothetical protein
LWQYFHLASGNAFPEQILLRGAVPTDKKIHESPVKSRHSLQNSSLSFQLSGSNVIPKEVDNFSRRGEQSPIQKRLTHDPTVGFILDVNDIGLKFRNTQVAVAKKPSR